MLEVVAGVPNVPGSSRRSLEIPTVVPFVPGGSGRSLQVPAVVPDFPGGRDRSLVVAAVVPSTLLHRSVCGAEHPNCGHVIRNPEKLWKNISQTWFVVPGK